jgi:hypothetical protein
VLAYRQSGRADGALALAARYPLPDDPAPERRGEAVAFLNVATVTVVRGIHTAQANITHAQCAMA